MTQAAIARPLEYIEKSDNRQTLQQLIDSIPNRRVGEFDEYYAEECRQWNLISSIAVATFVVLVGFVCTVAVGCVMGWW